MLRKRIRRPDIPLWARNSAVHYLLDGYRLSDPLHYQLSQVVHGYVGGCDADAARKGVEWLRERYRELGQTATF